MENNQGAEIGGVLRSPTLEEERERLLPLIKQFRQDVDELIQRTERSQSANTEASGKEIIAHDFQVNKALHEVRINLIQAKMWGGKMLEYLGNPFPAELADKAK